MLPEADVDVPLFVVCQYQISPPDGVPVLVRVTPGDAHCGELLVGFAGAVGNEYTVNVPALVAVFAPSVTVTFPVVPLPIIAVIAVPVFETILETAVPPI